MLRAVGSDGIFCLAKKRNIRKFLNIFRWTLSMGTRAAARSWQRQASILQSLRMLSSPHRSSKRSDVLINPPNTLPCVASTWCSSRCVQGTCPSKSCLAMPGMSVSQRQHTKHCGMQMSHPTSRKVTSQKSKSALLNSHSTILKQIYARFNAISACS